MWKWMPAILAVVVGLIAWGVFVVGVVSDWDKPVMVGIAVVGALGLEATMWTTAAALGITVFQARRQIWALVTGSDRQKG
ncbi:MAG: hypothetical protein V4466_16570 [Pseudomonadota bacterium]